MAENSKIEWTRHTANLWWGCTKVHVGCDHCYAETLSNRWNFKVWGNENPRREIKGFFNDLNRYQEKAAALNEIHRVFVGSMMDIFEKPMPLIDTNGPHDESYTTGSLREIFFNRIEQWPNLLFLLLTKRPSNINKYIPHAWKENPPANVMFGTSPVNQETADVLIPQLLKVKGYKFLSIEPLLGPLDLHKHFNPQTTYNDDGEGGILKDWEYESEIDWVITGGESGHGARPMHPEWVHDIHWKCQQAHVPFFFKQWGEWREGARMNDLNEKGALVCIDGTILKNDEPIPSGKNATLVSKVGKKEAGHLLNGKEYFNFPNI